MYELLVVDDEPLIREYMRKNIPLLNENWTVAGEAMDGLEALRLIDARHYDMVITDIRMPEMDGLALAERIRMSGSDIMIAILSGYDDFSYAKEAVRTGVTEYLLKPLVKSELSALLDKASLKIDKERRKEAAILTMQKLSNESLEHVVKNFLKAVLADSNVEIKSLYPLIHKMRISLMDSPGAILALEMDEDALLCSDLPPSDIPIYRFILNRLASEVLENEDAYTVFFDENENSKVFVTGDTPAKVLERSKYAYEMVSQEMMKHTSISVSAAVGFPVLDAMQLKGSGDRADDLLLERLESGGNRMFYREEDFSASQNSDEEKKSKLSQKLQGVVNSVQRALLENSEASCHIVAEEFAHLVGKPEINAVYRYGIFLLKRISGRKAGYPDEKDEAALRVLAGIHPSAPEQITLDEIVSVFHKMLCVFVSDSDNEQRISKNEIVSQAMDYIYVHYSEPISLALVAEKTGVSSCYLSDIFRKSTGESYIKFLTRIRMEHASKLLCPDPPPKVSDVAEMVGYINAKHFSYIFKQHFNVTPGEYSARRQKY